MGIVFTDAVGSGALFALVVLWWLSSLVRGRRVEEGA